MCGIYVEVSLRNDAVGRDRVARAAALLGRRGPDDEGFFFDRGAALAHRRLSIIDLSTGKQPIANETGEIVIVYNGEVYNFPELRRDLEARGHRFRTRTDTEVILHLYEEKGEAAPEYLNGAFAFAIWDARRRRLFFCRDRFGIKPLYMKFRGDVLFLSSDIRPLLTPGAERLDLESLDDFFTYGYVPGERTVWEGIRELEPAAWGIYDEKGIRFGRYWNPPDETEAVDLDRWTDEFMSLLADAVKIRLVSDVPLGAFLSGGIDSSTVVALMSRFGRVKAFTVGFPRGTQDEREYARLVADAYGCEQIVEELSYPVEEDVVEAVSSVGEPFADPSLLPTFLICRMAGRRVKVALAGDGADELFGGYLWLTNSVRQFSGRAWTRRIMGRLGSVCERIAGPSPRGISFLSRFCRYARDGRGDILSAFLRRRTVFAPELKHFVYTEDFFDFVRSRPIPYLHRFHRGDTAGPEDLLDLDFRYYLPGDILTKVDRTSMHHSLELRVPFLDHRIVEHVLSLNPEYRYRFGPKFLLKKAVGELLPRRILTKPKQGFGIPLSYYFSGSFWRFVSETILDGRPAAEGFVDRGKVENLLSEQKRGRADWSVQLWTLLVASLWWEEAARFRRRDRVFADALR